MRFHLKTQLFLYEYASVHSYPMKTIDENGTFRKRSPDWNFFENAVFACTCGQTKTELFENAEDTLSVSIDSAQYYETYSRWWTSAFLSCRLYLGLFPT